MIKLYKVSMIVLIIKFLIFNTITIAQSVGINATGAAPDGSALLDLNSSNKGFLITRADTANIVAPAFGLMTLAPGDSCLYLYNGLNWMGMGGGGVNCTCNCNNSSTSPVFPCNGTVIPIVDVTNPSTGKIWMDRNLGANQVATSSTDTSAYGDLFQWGRCSDGHEKRNSATNTTLSATDTPGHSDFITSTSMFLFDWRNPQNNNLWQGITGINNPCPTGYRIPTEVELENERTSWLTDDAAGAYGSPLKLTVAGSRYLSNGAFGNVGTAGGYWSSTINGASASYLYFFSYVSSMSHNYRGNGYSVRCIKD